MKTKLPKLALDLPTLDMPELEGGIDLPDLGLLPKQEPEPEEDRVMATQEAVIDLNTIAGRAKQERARFRQATDTEHWVCVCFETREQKEEFLRGLKLLDLGDKHINGLVAAQRLGVALKSPRPTWGRTRINEKLAAMAEKTDPTSG